MKTTFIPLMALGIAAALAGPVDRALAGEPLVLTEQQLDKVTAGNHEGRVAYFAYELKNIQDVEISFVASDRARQNDNFLGGFALGDDGTYVQIVPGGRFDRISP